MSTNLGVIMFRRLFILLFCFQALMASAASLINLRSFGFVDRAASFPQAELIEGSDGKLYGTTTAGGHADKGTVFRTDLDGSNFLVLKSFGASTNDGQRPTAALLEGSDGYLYGVAEEGGQFGKGVVFRLDKSGADFALLRSFAGTNGAYPEAKLLEGSDGFLYGTTSGGGTGTNDYGVVFRLNKNGSGYSVLKFFGGLDGANPVSGLIEGFDGELYGQTTFGGGTNLIPSATSTVSSNIGTIYRIGKNGSGFTVLKHFFWSTAAAAQTNGYYPYGQLIQGTNGMLYGTTSAGGREFGGTVYCINTNGNDFAILCSLTNSTGNIPLGGLTQGSDGGLYGVTFNGGVSNSGAFFRIDQDGNNYATLASISGGQGAADVLQASDGKFYGTTTLGGCFDAGTIFRIQIDGAAFTVLKDFSPSGGDGQSAYAGLVRSRDELFYGNTRLGGGFGAGAIYAIDALGRNYRLVSSLHPTNGANPIATLIEDSGGLLAGVSIYGGASNRGTLFQASPAGQNLAMVRSLGVGDGYFTAGALVESTNGYYYGVGAQYGAGVGGALFRVRTDGSDYSILKQFTAGALNPMQSLLLASDGKLYGTTYFSYLTQSSSPPTNGCIFRIDQDGGNYVIIKNFDNRLSTGANPKSPLLEASDGLLYGTTYSGGTTNDAGTIFRINKNGTGFQILRAFSGLAGDGRHPCGTVVESSDGFIYGATERGGTHDKGALFRLAKDGSSYAVLASFDTNIGVYPRSGVVLGPNDALYGTTDQGGPFGAGGVFRYGGALEYISQVAITNQQAVITCIGESGINYQIERSTNLATPVPVWSLVQSTNAPETGRFEVVDVLPVVDQAFYRMKR